MKVKRINRGYTVHLTDCEFSVLARMGQKFDINAEWRAMSSGERRAWSRRIRNGEFLRVDTDNRK